ncbi:deoxyguanosinetriphosphate triphosphohydrolase [Candidatus Liberibacter solanacearum]|uniref:deoxyguanosinetriphosphate triphosphohydrolase n=1 Tax=Candidatus Liberibacter solanacearum TaxID=556287 RepID=UPI0005F9EEE6|nr:deoxyguanosinetriphosphate triphosphohydrolase [Candidatus Liberibacter solanacearum]KJZ80768.1 deoxyguanosinetriphosphate triphosphohydrolase [Candidatus Liberibacter solanacearum]KQC49711.1 deoxyguanosinetriphosphate triphosphohydrolase [Candidatus Liberibacter solanacearum]
MIARRKLGFGYQKKAVYAANPAQSLGRIYEEKKSLTRSEFQRDRDRIIHTTAFRRLKDKTQVFFGRHRDHYRTRLLHTIEVSQIARSLARALRLDEDLAEGIALAHDFGHPPFGHTGENILQELLAFCGGFDHNIQSFRIVTELEKSYADFDGINLTWEVLEGLLGHNGPFLPQDSKAPKSIPKIFFDYQHKHGLNLSSFANLEAQVAAIADDIAYNAHDIDDSVRAGFLTFDMLEEISFLKKQIIELKDLYHNLDDTRLAHELVRRQITAMVEDVITVSQNRIAQLKPRSIHDIRSASYRIVDFSDDMAIVDKEIKSMLFKYVYHHPRIMICRDQIAGIIRNLFSAYMSDSRKMRGYDNLGCEKDITDAVKARKIGDYLAGMTDSYAIREHNILFGYIPDFAVDKF